MFHLKVHKKCNLWLSKNDWWVVFSWHHWGAGHCKSRTTREEPHDQYLLFNFHPPLEHKLWVITPLNHQAETVPTKKEGRRRNRATSGDNLKPVFTQTGPLSKPLKDPEQRERRRQDKVTLLSVLMNWETQEDLDKSWQTSHHNWL